MTVCHECILKTDAVHLNLFSSRYSIRLCFIYLTYANVAKSPTWWCVFLREQAAALPHSPSVSIIKPCQITETPLHSNKCHIPPDSKDPQLFNRRSNYAPHLTAVNKASKADTFTTTAPAWGQHSKTPLIHSLMNFLRAVSQKVPHVAFSCYCCCYY